MRPAPGTVPPGGFRPTQRPAAADPLANQPVVGLSRPPLGATPRAPIREESSITQFKRSAGDGSRSVILLIIAAAVAAMVFIFAFPKEPPQGLDAPSERAPKDLVQAALQNPKSVEAEPDDPEEPASAEAAPVAPVDPAVEAPKVPTTGKLVLETDPVVSVFVESEGQGRTPVELDLPVGSYKVRFTDAKTGINMYRRYRIRPGAVSRDNITFGKTTLRITAPDGAAIELNGRNIGRAPMEPVEIYEGEYLLRVVHQGATWSERFTAPPGRTVDYKVEFKPTPGK